VTLSTREFGPARLAAMQVGERPYPAEHMADTRVGRSLVSRSLVSRSHGDPAERWRLIDVGTPHEVPGWDELASGRSFYVAADWLRFADTDRVARSEYLGLSIGGRLVAALSSHWATDEVDGCYVAARTLELPSGAPSIDGGVLTFGGRRGFLSGVLIAPEIDHSAAAGHLAELIRHAMGMARQGAAWWWPYLISDDVDLVVAAGPLLGGTAGLGVHLIGADCVIEVVGATVDDHVAALPTQQRRTNFRRERQRFIDSGLEIRQINLPDYWPRLGPLMAAVQQKYGHPQSADEMRERLRRQGEHLASRAVVFACFDDDVIVGFALAYRWGDELALRVVGFDYERLLGAEEYAQLAIHAPLRYCYEHGLRRLHLGTASYEAKCRRGARARPLWAVTSLPGSEPAAVARTARRIAASMPAHESKSFTAQVEQSSRRWTALGS
jgi:uncharacterized protein